jgi:hypothetical protein
MLRPNDLQVTDYTVALKPTLGYEQQLWVSTGTSTELGTLAVQAPNSGVYMPSVADNATLASVPQELLAVLESDVDCGASDMVLTVNGTDQNGAALTGTATFSIPAYSSIQNHVFPKGYGVEVTTPSGISQFKTVSSLALTSTASANGAKISLFGVPSLSTYIQIGCKTQLNYDPRVPLPHSVQAGRDLSAYVKLGEIPEGAMEVTAKIPVFSDGLSRINGRRVTGLIKEIKEDKLDTMHVFVMGLILTSKVAVGESVDPATLSATAKFEDMAIVLAKGAGQA